MAETTQEKVIILRSISQLDELALNAQTLADYIQEISSSTVYNEVSKSNTTSQYDPYKLNIGNILTMLYSVIVDLSSKIYVLNDEYNVLSNKFVTLDTAQTISGRKYFNNYVDIENQLSVNSKIITSNLSASNLSANNLYAGENSSKFNLSATSENVITQKLSCIETAEITARHALWS